jgi:hypothetical protein
MTREWYRGPITDWVRAAVVGPLLALMGWLSFYVQTWSVPKFATISGAVTYISNIPWVEGLTMSLPYGIGLIPIIVLGIRWYWAGEPLPEGVTARPYIVYAKGCAILQAMGVLTAWSMLGYTLYSGTEMLTVVKSMPILVVYGSFVLLSLGITVGLVGPTIFMYLDARYIDDRDALTAFDAKYVLLAIPLIGIQFAGIPTLLAVWYYDSRRDTATVDRVISYHA